LCTPPALADVIARRFLVKILHRFLQSSAVAIKIIFGFNSTLIVGGSYLAMTILRKSSAGVDHWAVQVSFALCVAGLAAWLITLYWNAPVDF